MAGFSLTPVAADQRVRPVDVLSVTFRTVIERALGLVRQPGGIDA